MRYYTTQRPVGPGTYPRKDGMESYVNFFAGRIFCEEIGREAWGYIEYGEELTQKEMRNYELIKGGSNGKVIEGQDSRGKTVAFIYDPERGDRMTVD